MRKIVLFLVAAFLILSVVICAGCTSSHSTYSPVQTIKTPTPIPTPTVGSVGEKFISKLGTTKIKWSVDEVIRGTKANELVKEASLFKSKKPQSGYEFVLYKVSAENLEGGSYSVSDSTWPLYANGVSASSGAFLFPDNYPELRYVSIIPGGQVSGWISKEVPIGSELRVYFNSAYDTAGKPADLYIKL